MCYCDNLPVGILCQVCEEWLDMPVESIDLMEAWD